MPTLATLCHIVKDDKLLLQRKSKGLFGGGKWNGVGGKLEAGETPEECVKREVYEETGLRVSNLRLNGVLHFYFGERHEADWIVFVFSTETFEGSPKPSVEGALRWFPVEGIPYQEMWQDDRHWLPLLLRGERFKGYFYFDEEGGELLDFNLESGL
ncbi:MAG: 8-oxo-dGTP diphosphatase [Candidatus Bathyarchaeia archaeon]|nr:8-oxo-dGTP diphosphatase [Candidatus Bathyarchaeota archaeon]